MSEDAFHSLSLDYVEALLQQYQQDPQSVPEDFREYFRANLTNGGAQLGPSFTPRPLFGSSAPASNGTHGTPSSNGSGVAQLQHAADEMVRNFRILGHASAQLNPLVPAELAPRLELANFGLGPEDLERTISTVNLPGVDHTTVAELYERLKRTYCDSIGAEFMHINDLEARGWLQERMEVTQNRTVLDRASQLRILGRLSSATVFESFIQKKYLGAKSFSLEGAEGLIPLLDLAIEKAGNLGVEEVVLGMAHRGRLNVLCNIMGKSPHDIFREFEDVDPEEFYGSGDVKYHMGYSSDWHTASGHAVHLSMAFNPSHLEFINPVAQGRIRAKQDQRGDAERTQGMVLLIHGDAAFAGEGVVQETLNLSELRPYEVGGTVHVIVNNQIGFTTEPHEARSNTYATDVAKMLQIPIFHVNGEEPEAVAHVVEVALDFRQRFQRDVVIDMYCYRRRGHNEGDEPAFTQPHIYKEIRSRRDVGARYLDHLLRLGEITREEANSLTGKVEEVLEDALKTARAAKEKNKPQAYDGLWSGYVGGADGAVEEAETGVDEARLGELLEKLTELPDSFQPHPKLKRILEARRQMARGERPLDWSAAEALAFATLATEKHRVRMSGQDCERGTFSHRHAVLHDFETNDEYMPLAHLSEDQASVEIYNSALSEAGVLGFEYGYSLDCPHGLILWEAQFGDFANAAQVVIDQFITSAEDKWNRLSGLVMLLPHGFEGQGPEHSSARLERWLSLAAEDNIQIVYPTTPAQIFHVLRRQIHRPIRKPLVVLTPKSMLRHPAVTSSFDDLARGHFQRVLPDPRIETEEQAKKVDRVLLCSGKLFYELAERYESEGRDNVALVRVEQLYPLPEKQLEDAFSWYRDDVEMVWVQEEPRNMGAWPTLRLNYANQLLGRYPFRGIYRQESASPATGSAQSHKIEQEELLSAAFAGL
ncbi:MAG: 2-oxoglutarate dehydrogenase E1 component [Acidobacteriota bacterium]